MDKLEQIIRNALPELREITFHSDGRIIAKTGGRAKFPRKLYKGIGESISDKIINSLEKIIKENK